MAKRVSLDVDSSIIEKNLIITEQDSCELDSLFPKQEENAILIKPLPVPIKMSDEVNLELKEQNNKNNNESDSNSSNLNTKNDNIVIENLELKNSTGKKVIDDNSTNNDNISDNTDSNNPKPILIQEDNVKLDIVESTSTSNSTDPTPDNVESVLNNKQEVDAMVIGDEKCAVIQTENTSNQNEETHDEIDITLEYDDVEDQLLNDGPGEESAISEEKSETKTNEANSQNADEKDTATPNVETTKIVESNDNPDKQNQAPLGRCLWVSGLSHTTRANDLKQHFVSQGRVIGAKVVSNSRSPGARCYGYIVMSTPEEADACVKNLHHSKLLNRFISVQKAKSDKQSDNNGNGNESTDVSPHKNVDSNVIKSKKIEDEKASDTGDIITNDEPLKSESSTSIDKKKKDTKEGSPKRLHKGIESSDKKYPRDSNKRRRDSKEKHSSKKSSHDNKDKKIDKYQRLREERERERRINEERRIREVQRRQREEAARLDRERQMLRIERERLQREKMELLRLEKEQLEKEREELKRQKLKIEEASRKKHEAGRSERIKKRRERSRSPPNRRSPEIPIKLSKKRELEKFKDPGDRHFGSIDKHKDINKYKEPTSKDAYRGGYKDRHDFEYNRPMDTKYDRYPPEKKDGNYKPRDMDMKTDDFLKNSNFSSKRNDDIGFEPPPPRISTNEANHFSVLPISHTTYGPHNSSNNRMLRDDFHNKDMFMSNMPNMSSSRNVDRVSDRFPIERHDRLPNENIDMNHRSRSYMSEMDCFPKQETSRMVPPVRQDRLDRDNIRVNRDDRHMDPMPIRSNAGRYSEHERDFHHRDQSSWYMDRMGPSKRMMPPTLPARGDGMLNRASWEAARYDQSIRPPGVYSSSIDRKIDRH